MWSTWKESLSETRDTNQKLLNNGLYCHMYVVYFIKMNNNTGRATSTAAIVLLIPPPDLVKFSCCFIFSLDFMDSFVAHSSSFLFVIVLSNLLWLMASYPFVIFRHSPQFMVMSSRCKTTVLDISYETSFLCNNLNNAKCV